MSQLKERKRGRIITRIGRLADKLTDLKEELDEQRFPVNSPAQKDVAIIKIYISSLLDHLDESIQMRNDVNKPFSLEEDES